MKNNLTDEEINRNNARLAAIIESSEDAIFAKNLDGIVTDWNKSAERLYGYRRGNGWENYFYNCA